MELLIVIVVIAILASITTVAFNGVRSRAADAKRDADLKTLQKAIMIARINTSQTLYSITGQGWTEGECAADYINTSLVEPRLLPKTHSCWTTYYNGLDLISQAAGINLSALKDGDARGNPYTWDENQGEWTCEDQDQLLYFGNSDATTTIWGYIPLYEVCSM